MKKLTTTLLVLLLAQAPADMAFAQAKATTPGEFVQQFYNWYVPIINKVRQKEDPIGVALRSKKAAFAPALASALKADLDASAKSPGEIVGLEYDPFVYSQDPCGRYQVGKVVQNGDKATVEVFAICRGKKEKTPAVLVSLTQQAGNWTFIDFGSAENPNELTKTLEALQQERKQSASSKR